MNNKSNEQLGRELAEKAGLKVEKNHSDAYIYELPDKIWHLTGVLCNSLDAVSEIEKIVIEKVGTTNYLEALMKTHSEAIWQNWWASNRVFSVHLSILLTTSARQRAEACLLALTEKI